MAIEITPIQPTLGDPKITLPNEEELLARFAKYNNDPHVLSRFHPELAKELADQTLLPLGVANKFLFTAVSYAKKTATTPGDQARSQTPHPILETTLRDTVLMMAPAYFEVMIDNGHTLRHLLGVWLWLAHQADIPHGPITYPSD